MLGGKKSHTYLHKPAAKRSRLVKYVTFFNHQVLKGWVCVVYILVLITLIKKASWKRFLNEELKQRFLLNVYINVLDLFFDFAVHKLCRTLEKLILHFEVSISRFWFLYYT